MPVQLGFKAKDIIAEGRVTNDDIKQIKIWLNEQNTVPVISDEEIVNFLISNNNDQEKTKSTIDAFFKIRNEGPDIFNNRLSSNENSIAYFGIAPKRTKDNCAVIFARIYDTRFRWFNLSQYFKSLFMTLDAAIYSKPASGLIMVMDMDGYGIMHLTKLRPSTISLFFRYLQEALPVKLKNIHVLNTAYFIDRVLAIIKPFMSDHINEQILFHRREMNMEEFFETYVAKELLPQDFGGELPCMKTLNDLLTEKFKSMETYFKAEEDRRYLMP